MTNKNNLSLSLPSLLVDQNNPQQKRKKELNSMMKRFGELLDPSGYQPNEQILEEKSKMIDDTPLRQLLRKRDRIKTHVEYKMYCNSLVNSEKALIYSQSKQSEIQFNKQFRMKKKAKVLAESLTAFMDQKETEKFLKQNEHNRNSHLAEIFLEDGAVRQNILQKAFLFERFYEQRKQENRLKSTSEIQIPKRFKGINPKHIRLPTTPRNQTQFKHMKYIEHQKKLQFFEKTLSAQNRDVDNKLNANSNLIELVVSLNQEYAKQKVQTDEDKELSLLFKRLFLHYSNHEADNPDNLYTNITKQRAEDLLDDFNISTNLITNEQFKFPIGSFKFQQFIGRISKQMFGDIKFPTRKITKQIFLPMKDKFLHPLFQYIEQNQKEIDEYFNFNIKKSFQLKKIFMKMTNKTIIEGADKVMFREVFQKLWNLKIFPNLIHKSSIRYYFESYNTDTSGIAFKEFRTFMLVISLHIFKNQASLPDKLNKLFSIIKTYLAKC